MAVERNQHLTGASPQRNDMSDQPKCEICGEPMPKGEELFSFHVPGTCPKPPLKSTPPTNLPQSIDDVIQNNVEHVEAEIRKALTCVPVADRPHLAHQIHLRTYVIKNEVYGSLPPLSQPNTEDEKVSIIEPIAKDLMQSSGFAALQAVQPCDHESGVVCSDCYPPSQPASTSPKEIGNDFCRNI